MRLTNSDRRGIVERAVAAKFDPLFAALVEEKKKLALKLYDLAFSSKTRAWAKQAPKGWLRADSCLRFNVSGHSIKITIPGDGMPVPYNHGYCGEHRITVADDGLRDLYSSIDDRERDLKKQRDTVTVQLSALLDRLTTLAKVKEVWPEGAAFYDALSPRERVEVPAVQVSEINALLGLAA